MKKITVMHNIGDINGLSIIIPKIFEDNRGYFSEVYNDIDLLEEGITSLFVQDNEQFSKKGVLRGLHVNKKNPQAKLIRVLDGEIFDVVIDLREDSETYKKCYSIILSADNKKQLYIPEKFAHGYFSMTDTRVLFKTTTHWDKNDEIGFAWNSEEFNIDWPVKQPILSEKDKASPDFSWLVF